MTPITQCALPGGHLRTADILVTNSQTFNSAVIREATCAPVSHALLMTSPTMAIEAMPSSGVEELALKSILSMAKETKSKVYVLRHRSISFTQSMQVAKFARGQAGKNYDTIGALRSAVSTGCAITRLSPLAIQIKFIDELGKLGPEEHDRTFFCSELVARAFEIAGVPLSRHKPKNISPGALLYAEALYVVGQIV